MGSNDRSNPVAKRASSPVVKPIDNQDAKPSFPILNKGRNENTRLSLLLWGQAGSGKTTWIATAPGRKLWLSFGDNEHIPIMRRSDVEVIPLFGEDPDELFKHAQGRNPFNLEKWLRANEFRTIVCDSLTAVQYIALGKAVRAGIGASNKFVPSMEQPGRAAFGGRNQHLLAVMHSLLTLTYKMNMHVIFTAHENDPQTKTEGGVETVDLISMSLGGQLVNNVTSRISEIWNFRQEVMGARNRIVTVRISAHRRPMKTRMFDQRSASSFILRYDPDKPDDAPGQMTLARFYEEWIAGGLKRIEVPDNRKGGDEADNNRIALKAV